MNDFNDYCLAYVFTMRDFENGVLGLAWVAQPEGSSGGICEKVSFLTCNSTTILKCYLFFYLELKSGNHD